MSREDRMKASDVFKKTNFVFSEKTTFEKAFPEIETVNVEYTETSYVGKNQGTLTRTEKNLGEYINCTNPLCYNGGFSIGQILRDMVRKKEVHWEGSKICQGYEGSPKGRRKYRSCVNIWNIKVDIVYRKDEKK